MPHSALFPEPASSLPTWETRRSLTQLQTGYPFDLTRVVSSPLWCNTCKSAAEWRFAFGERVHRRRRGHGCKTRTRFAVNGSILRGSYRHGGYCIANPQSGPRHGCCLDSHQGAGRHSFFPSEPPVLHSRHSPPPSISAQGSSGTLREKIPKRFAPQHVMVLCPSVRGSSGIRHRRRRECYLCMLRCQPY